MCADRVRCHKGTALLYHRQFQPGKPRLGSSDDFTYNSEKYTHAPVGKDIRHEYDRFHNRSVMTVIGAENYIVQYAYDKNNRFLKETKTEGKSEEVSQYGYDQNGSQLTREWYRTEPVGPSVPSGRIGFLKEVLPSDKVRLDMREYNGLGQMIYMRRDIIEARYSYRPDNLRHEKIAGKIFEPPHKHIKTVHHWDGQNMVMESNGAMVNLFLLYMLNTVLPGTLCAIGFNSTGN